MIVECRGHERVRAGFLTEAARIVGNGLWERIIESEVRGHDVLLEFLDKGIFANDKYLLIREIQDYFVEKLWRKRRACLRRC